VISRRSILEHLTHAGSSLFGSSAISKCHAAASGEITSVCVRPWKNWTPQLGEDLRKVMALMLLDRVFA
jgi:hypothetical protein